MYNGPSGPRRLLTMTVSSAYIAVAANIALTTNQITFLVLILISFPVSSGSTQHLFGRPTETESAHRFRVGVRFPFHEITLDVTAEFMVKNISAVFPKCLGARRADEVHDYLLPTHP